MPRDRYLRFILTIIAIELLWIGLKDFAPSAAAQAQPRVAAPAPVVITGIRLDDRNHDALPVSVIGNVTVGLVPQTVVRIRADAPIKVEADRPLPVRQEDYTPRVRPGE